MLLSPSMWSTQFMAVPFNNLTVNWYHAIADTDGTEITYPGGGYSLNAGGFVLFNASIGIIGMGDMGKMYAERLSAAGWR